MNEAVTWFEEAIRDPNDQDLLRRKCDESLTKWYQSAKSWSSDPKDAFAKSLRNGLKELKASGQQSAAHAVPSENASLAAVTAAFQVVGDLLTPSDLSSSAQASRAFREACREQGWMIHNGRPADQESTPLELLSPIFAGFMAQCSQAQPSAADCTLANALVETCSNIIGSELVDLQEKLELHFKQWIPGCTIHWAKRGQEAADGELWLEGILVGLIELKADKSGISRGQILGYYFKMVGAALEAHFYKRLTTTGFPVPLVEINNAMLMINGGMTLLKEASNSGYIVQQPLCDPTYLFGIHNSNHMRRIAKILTALRQTIIEIKVLAAKEASGPAYAPSALKELYPGGTYVDMHRGLVWGVVTREDHMLVAKYFSSERMQDAVAVQCKIAAVGLAPAVVQSQGFENYTLVVMSHLNKEDGWLPIDLLAKWTIHSPAAKKAYKTLSYAHFIELSQAVEGALLAVQKLPGRFVHGDLRANNIFARRFGDQWHVNFLDFATSGFEGTARAPVLKNRDLAELPSAPRGQLLSQALDLECLRYELQRLQSTYNEQRPM